MSPFDQLPICVAVRVGRRPTVYMTLDEAIFAAEGWPEAEIQEFEHYYEAANYLDLEPLNYPRWFRIILWPEIASDMTEPAIREAPVEEFRAAFIQMRWMGYPEERFPAWFMEKIQEEDRQKAGHSQAPEEAPISGQSSWVAKFGPACLTQRHRLYGTAEEHASRVAQAFATRSRGPLKLRVPFREGIKNPRYRYYPPGSFTPSPAIEQEAHAGSGKKGPLAHSASMSEIQSSRVTRWLADTSASPKPLSDNDAKSGHSEDLDGSHIKEEEVESIRWTFTSAPRNLTPTSALFLGTPGQIANQAAGALNPAVEPVDSLGSGDVQCSLDSVDDCLGRSASRYLHSLYYSQTSKAIIVDAYWYHHQDVDQFVTHVFRKGVLPRVGAYVWDLLQTSFNWKIALKAGIGKEPAQRLHVPRGSIDAEKLDFGPCLECREKGRLVLRVEEVTADHDGKGKGKVVE